MTGHKPCKVTKNKSAEQRREKMEITEITTGVLNNFSLFYDKAEFYNNGAEEVYEALKYYASKEMLKSAEMWTAKFEYKDKEYGIMGDGEMTSSGRYILGEIIEK